MMTAPSPRILLEKYHIHLLLFLLFLILIVAFSLRVYDLEDNPPGLYIDEVSSAYNAYSIMKTGMDEHGKRFPVYFQAFGEYRHGLYIYSMIPSLFIFGLNEFGVRFPSVVFGMICLIVLYFLAKKLFDVNIALLSVFFLAIQPWHMHLSRVAFEGISFVALFLIGLLLFYKGIYHNDHKKRQILLCFAACVFALSVYSYGIAKLFIPLFLAGLALIYRQEIRSREHMQKEFVICLVLFIILVAPVYYLSLFGQANARFEQGSIFILSKHPVFSLFLNYASHFSPQFLFFTGDNSLRHGLHNWGVLSYSSAIFVLFGLFWIWKQRHEKHTQMLMLWLFLFGFPASFMYGDTPNTLRAFIGAPLFSLICAIGLVQLWKAVQCMHDRLSTEDRPPVENPAFNTIHSKKVFFYFVCLVTGILFIESSIFFHEYFTDYKIYSYDYWMAYADPMMEYMEEHKHEYDHVYLSANSLDRFYIYALYYTAANPQQYLDNGLASIGYEICDINKCFNETEHNLYVFRGFELEREGTYTIYYPNQKDIAVKFWENT